MEKTDILRLISYFMFFMVFIALCIYIYVVHFMKKRNTQLLTLMDEKKNYKKHFYLILS